MKKNDVFTFTAPNGVEVQAIVIDKVAYDVDYKWGTETFVAYGQNRLFTFTETHCIWEYMHEEPRFEYGKVLIDYVVLPEYDEKLKLYAAMDYPQWEQNLEEEIYDTNKG